jgi:hypothetical protein
MSFAMIDRTISEAPVRAPFDAGLLSDSLAPTNRTYGALMQAYGHFNRELFGGALPDIVLTLQRKARSYGFFACDRFGTRSQDETTHEIALNPTHFRERDTKAILSTLVHEMCHLERFLMPCPPPKGGNHCKKWGECMERVGLIPSATGQPGGKKTGKKVSHYVEVGGRFDVAADALLSTGFDLAYVELWDESKREKKAASKTKYICPTCEQNAWAKPDAQLICGDCGTYLAPPD